MNVDETNSGKVNGEMSNGDSLDRLLNGNVGLGFLNMKCEKLNWGDC